MLSPTANGALSVWGRYDILLSSVVKELVELGNDIYVCTFFGHYTLMQGTLVVE